MPPIRRPGTSNPPPVAQISAPAETAPTRTAAPLTGAKAKALDGFGTTRAAAQPPVRGSLFHGTRDAYFAALDADPGLRTKANGDAVGAMLDLLSRPDVPALLDHEYTEKAGSKGAGRILMALDYTRGIKNDESLGDALKQGPMHVLASRIITPMLTHFREVQGASLFPGDATMPPAFRDSPLWGPKTNQVGHLLCAVEAGTRLGHYSQHGVERAVYELGLKAADKVAGFKNIDGTVADWSRAGIIGHEMIGDGDGGGFLAQMKAYDQLVAHGDPDHIRQHWDLAVAAVLAKDDAAAFTHIDAISKAIEAPTTAAEVEANLKNDAPRFAKPHQAREGNSREDIALSIYGFAMGYGGVTKGFATPEDARNAFEAQFSVKGERAQAIDGAAGVAR